MGFLHDGHLELVRRARAECDWVVVSVFVNPLQFGPSEDFASYPRDLARDRKLLRAEAVDLVFEPAAEELFPADFSTYVEVGELDARLCGPRRPGHFRGVATVVLKLLHAAEPDRLYLGQKDFQQAAILARMIRDLDLPVRVVLVPTVREPSGLALSSRNTYLSAAERAWAPQLHRALEAARAAIESGELRRPGEVAQFLEAAVAGGPGELEYGEAVGQETLAPVDPLRGPLVIALAYRMGRARLIDNVLLTAPGSRRRRADRTHARPDRARPARTGAARSDRARPARTGAARSAKPRSLDRRGGA
jgi:pantoate--beta-alanine ligase